MPYQISVIIFYNFIVTILRKITFAILYNLIISLIACTIITLCFWLITFLRIGIRITFRFILEKKCLTLLDNLCRIHRTKTWHISTHLGKIYRFTSADLISEFRIFQIRHHFKNQKRIFFCTFGISRFALIIHILLGLRNLS